MKVGALKMQKPLLFSIRYELEKEHKSLSISAEKLDAMAYVIWQKKMNEYNQYLAQEGQVKSSLY